MSFGLLSSGIRHKLFNFFAFEACWTACVLGAASGKPWLGLLAVGALVAVHLKMMPQPGKEIRLMLLALLFGAIFDSLLVMSGWLRYPNGMLLPGTAPVWILAMWVGFATTLNVSMSWLHGRYGLAVLLGAVFGPMSYYAGARLGAVELINSQNALAALAIGWAVAMPMLMMFARRHDGSQVVVSANAGVQGATI